jgi:hypothetical protein
MVMVQMTLWIAFILAADVIAPVYALPLAMPGRMSVFIFYILYCYLKLDKPSTTSGKTSKWNQPPPKYNGMALRSDGSEPETKSKPKTGSTVPKVKVPTIVITPPT